VAGVPLGTVSRVAINHIYKSITEADQCDPLSDHKALELTVVLFNGVHLVAELALIH
jgi:hypothetical protein